MQKKTPISATDTLGTVYFDRLFPQGVEAMMESVDLVKTGKAPRIKQDEAKATYEGRCGAGNAHIDWGKPWEQIDRLIWAAIPPPRGPPSRQAPPGFSTPSHTARAPRASPARWAKSSRSRRRLRPLWSAPTAASR
jgi:hypothetical protein